MNRADRRKEWKNIPGWMKNLAKEGNAVQSMVRHGITAQDLEKAEVDAYKRGMENGKQMALRTCYAGAALALNDLHGFGAQRVRRFLVAMDQQVMYSITSEEMVDEVFKRFGFRIIFKGYDALEGRVVENDA